MAAQPTVPRLDAPIQQVLDTLDWWNNLNSGHHSQKRGSDRAPYRVPIHVFIFDEKHNIGEPAKNDFVFHAWIRNLSRQGLSFVSRESRVLEKVAICLNGEATIDSTWVIAKVVWSRRIHDGFWEYGVELLDRINQ